jgi:hypothetical protein
VNESVLRRRMLVGSVIAGLLIILIITITYLTIFVWSNPPRPTPVGVLWFV